MEAGDPFIPRLILFMKPFEDGIFYIFQQKITYALLILCRIFMNSTSSMSYKKTSMINICSFDQIPQFIKNLAAFLDKSS